MKNVMLVLSVALVAVLVCGKPALADHERRESRSRNCDDRFNDRDFRDRDFRDFDRDSRPGRGRIGRRRRTFDLFGSSDRRPRGWDRGRKVGWGRGSLPPGLRKK